MFPNLQIRGVFLPIFLACACATINNSGTTSTNPRLRDIEGRIAASERRLEQIQAEVSSSEARAEEARQLAIMERCKAGNAQIVAQASAYQAQCLGEVAAYNACEAKRSEAKADGTIVGCLFGIGVALATSGAAAPLALGGCAVGRLASESGECPRPQCAAEFDRAELRALHQLGLTELPMCGGYTGVAVKNEYVTKRAGLKVRSVGSGTTAASLGLARGDVLLGLQGRTMSSAEDVIAVIGRQREGAKIRANVVRKHALLRVEGRVRNVAVGGVRGRRAHLGAALDKTTAKVRYADAVTVTRVDGPAKAAGLVPGLVIRGINDQLIHDRDGFRRALSELSPGTSVRFQVMRSGRLERVEVTLEDREGRTSP